MQPDVITSQWAAGLGMQPTADGWTVELTLSTVPMSHWFYKRNKLRPEDVKLSLTAPSWGHWVAQLDRHDRQYQVQWRQGNDLRVESEQLRFRKLLKWPAMPNLESFPNLIKAVEAALGIKFIRHANVGARFIELNAPQFDDRKLHEWLAPCADTWGQLMRDAGDKGGDEYEEN